MKTMNTKKALIASLLSLVLCVSMLVGSTFAWFTDTASTGVNRITSGNLSVEIQDESGNKLTKTVGRRIRSCGNPVAPIR